MVLWWVTFPEIPPGASMAPGRLSAAFCISSSQPSWSLLGKSSGYQAVGIGLCGGGGGGERVSPGVGRTRGGDPPDFCGASCACKPISGTSCSRSVAAACGPCTAVSGSSACACSDVGPCGSFLPRGHSPGSLSAPVPAPALAPGPLAAASPPAAPGPAPAANAHSGSVHGSGPSCWWGGGLRLRLQLAVGVGEEG